jgi:hypothetical protein
MKPYGCRAWSLSGWVIRLFLLWAAAAILSGCAGNYGAIHSNAVLLDQYKGGGLPDQYNYYYCGRSSIPYAVVGIDKSYGFNERVWFKIASKEEVYKKIANLSDLHRDATHLFTSDILDTQGRKIGIWFSFYNTTPVQIDPETRMVNVYNPYNPNDDYRGF